MTYRPWQTIQYKIELPYYYVGDEKYALRQCEVCGNSYGIPYNRREVSVCGGECSLALVSTYKGGDDSTIIYNDLLVELGRHPRQAEWAERCQAQNITINIDWRQVQELAGLENHRVVSVEHVGNKDVYTGTVDESHTYFAIGGDGDTSSFVLNVNCGEINLKPMGLCNLSIAVARHDDTEETLKAKVWLATVIGTIQSMATHFPGLRDGWKENCIRERLLGVDITGQMDSEVARDSEVQVRYAGS